MMNQETRRLQKVSDDVRDEYLIFCPRESRYIYLHIIGINSILVKLIYHALLKFEYDHTKNCSIQFDISILIKELISARGLLPC